MKVLFVQGHNTQGSDTYRNFKTFFLGCDATVTYLDYSLTDDIVAIYKSMCDLIKINKFDYILAHSMGGCFVSRYIAEHDVSKFTKIILMMPLICKKPLLNLICKIPMIEQVVLPKTIIYPARSLNSNSSFVTDVDAFKRIPLKQITDCYNKFLTSDETTSRQFNRNCVLIYAKEENFTNINESMLNAIKNKRIVPGRHECFNERSNREEFFNVLKQEMDLV
jgi:hypothetical protein